MKSIFKNKISLFTSLILVVVMVFSSVSYAAEGDSNSNQVVFTDDMFTDSGYKDGSLDSVDSIWGLVGAADVNNSGMYQEAVDKWGKDNVDVYYCISTSPCGYYTLYNVLYLFCQKGANIGITSFVASTDKYKHYYIQIDKEHSSDSMAYRRYWTGSGTWDSSKQYNPSDTEHFLATYGTLEEDSVIICSNIPRFDSKDKMEEYLRTGNPDGALNYVNPDSDDSSAFGWDSFKGTLSGAGAHEYKLVVNRSYSSLNMINYPDQYYVTYDSNIKLIGKDKTGAVVMGGYKFVNDGKILLSDFNDGYIEDFSNLNGRLSVYGWHPSIGDTLHKEFGEIIQLVSSFIAGSSSYDVEITSCRLYVTYYLYCENYGIALPRRSNDVRCLSFDLLNYDGSSQGGEAVDPAEGTENGGGSGGDSSGGTGDINQGINININNENTQNNGTGSGSDSSPKIDVADDDFSMTNVWKNVKSLFGLIDDPSTPEPDDGVMQVVKAGMDFLPSQYWTIVLGLLSSAGIVSIIRIFRGS